MGYMVRKHPSTPCVESHHPHRWICDDPDCGCDDDYDDGQGYGPYSALICCVDGEGWPCRYRRNKEARHGNRT